MAKKVAELEGCKSRLREHLGQRVALRLSSKLARYEIGNPGEVEVSVEMKNVGTKPILAAVELDEGLKERLRSVDLELFPIEGCQKNCIDLREQNARSSVIKVIEVKPGEIVMLTRQDLLYWFRPKSPGAYKFEGVYRLGVYRELADLSPIWEERIAGDLELEFE